MPLYYSTTTMTRTEIFKIWAPDSSVWSRWAKPALFAADAAATEVDIQDPEYDLTWCPPADGHTALVLDLPGSTGVYLGLVLAKMGYRPVPLYNAVPLPLVIPDVPIRVNISEVDVLPILSALVSKAPALESINVPPDAPPAFLLDFNRHGSGMPLKEGQFDNRSISMTTDFPSAIFFAAHGINRILLVQLDHIYYLQDLAHSLHRWQDGGLELYRVCLELPNQPQPFEVSKPIWYKLMFQRALASLGLHRRSAGGFGGWVPYTPSGG